MGKLFHFFELKQHIRPLGKTDGKYWSMDSNGIQTNADEEE